MTPTGGSGATPSSRFSFLDRGLGRLTALFSVLVLPVSLLLFLQWPLREAIQAWSREANDLAQWLFALYISLAVTQASRRGTHLAADALATRYSLPWRNRLRRLGAVFCIAPWAAFLLWAGSGPMLASLRQWETFPETYNPGYFIVKLALGLLALAALTQALVEALRPEEVD